MKLKREFFMQDAYNVGLNLIGKILWVNHQAYRIVETESYGGATDEASHAFEFRRTRRTEPLYVEGGHLYIYFIYGMYHMLNITCCEVDNPEAVLIRALEPMTHEAKTNGPGKLCRALHIDMTYNGVDLCQSETIYIEEDPLFEGEIGYSKRINIDYALHDKERLWRFFLKNNPYVSK